MALSVMGQGPLYSPRGGHLRGGAATLCQLPPSSCPCFLTWAPSLTSGKKEMRRTVVSRSAPPSYLPRTLNWEMVEGGEESPEERASASFCELRQSMPLLPNMSSA